MPQRSNDPVHCRAQAAAFARMAKLSPFPKDRQQFQARAEAWLARARALEAEPEG
jgi:hypothetical protein